MTTSKSTIKAGLIETTVNTYRKEGVRAFYSGFWPAIIRGLFYGGVRLGKSMIFSIENIPTIFSRQSRCLWTDQKYAQTFRYR